jgi:hypothetical protein
MPCERDPHGAKIGTLKEVDLVDLVDEVDVVDQMALVFALMKDAEIAASPRR